MAQRSDYKTAMKVAVAADKNRGLLKTMTLADCRKTIRQDIGANGDLSDRCIDTALKICGITPIKPRRSSPKGYDDRLRTLASAMRGIIESMEKDLVPEKPFGSEDGSRKQLTALINGNRVDRSNKSIED